MKKNFANLNYYEILDVTHDAAFFEIRHAYNAAMQMYRADSLVSYSFFSLEERQEILNLLEKAYLTLINGKERKNYDKELIQLGILENVGGRAGAKRSAGIYDASRQWGRAVVLKNNTTTLKEKVAQNKRINEILSKQEINGADLKAIRNELGVAIEKIAGETKIRMDYLISIEENKVKRLPAAAFLKGFIKSYLKCLCIEPSDDVCVRYMDGLARMGKNN
jgi:curved DNA-binding protein CbpA